SLVVAPSYRPLIVLVATRNASTSSRPTQQRLTARTILLTSTGSRCPLRLVTRMVVRGSSLSSPPNLRLAAGLGTWSRSHVVSARITDLLRVGENRGGEASGPCNRAQ